MGHSFVGGYFLSPYIHAFEEALNAASLSYDDAHPDTVTVTSTTDTPPPSSSAKSSSSSKTNPGPKKPYTMVKTANVGYTAIILFARNPESVLETKDAEVGFGAAEMGNKGAVGLRCLYGEEEGGSTTELTFVATHLAAMEWNLAKRNANWASIVRGLTFENPEAVVERHRVSGEHGEASETSRLLHEDLDEAHRRLQKELHDISVYKPSSHLFVGGDLNYRISTTSPPPGAAFPSLDEDSEHHYLKFWPLDQLTREKEAGRTLHGLSEGKVEFPPTYKYVVKPNGKDDENPRWEFAPHRYPSWTDRILYLNTPSSLPDITVETYDAMPILASSDHRPVFLRASVPLVSRETLEGALKDEDVGDPRVRLPVEIDPEAWERRQAARRKEVMAGWSMMLWSSKEGAAVLGTLVALGVGCYLFMGGAGGR